MNKTLCKQPKTLRGRYSVPSKSLLALGVSAAIFGQVAVAEEAIVLDTLQVEERTIDTNPYAEAGAPYKAKVSGDSRHVKDLADTPQTISVLTQTQIKESGKDDLKEILQAQPGVTLGTGENGNAFGDRYIIRGHESRSDVFVDGLRDPGMTTRESFATEQVEITKGPSSTFAGRGSTGGAVNSVTKQASTEYNFTKISAGLGTDNYGRFSVDSNTALSDSIALRANLLYSEEEVPDRAPADRQRKGLALSSLFKVTDQFQVIADYYYLDANDSPDLGTFIVAGGGSPVHDLPVYGQDSDFLNSEISTGTLRLKYQFNDALRLENATRYGTTENGYVTTGAMGTTRHATDPLAPGAATIGLSTHQGWQDVEYWANQSNLFWDIDVGKTKHQFVFSAEYTDMGVVNGVYNITNRGATNCVVNGRGGASNSYCMVGPNGLFLHNRDDLMGREISRGARDSNYNIETTSLAVMDTITFDEHWSLFLGVRYDKFNYGNKIGSVDPRTNYTYRDELWNGHAGLVYNFNEDANVYLTYSTSSNINGGESDLGANCGYGGICGTNTVEVSNSKPEDTENWELGTKMSFANDKLLLSAAVFRITKDDVMESVGGAYTTIGTLNTGKNRVQGVEVSLVGNITDKLSAQFGVTAMDSEIIDSFVKANEGLDMSNFADESAFLQLRFQATERFAFGGTATYSSKMYAGQPDSAAGYNAAIDDYSYTVPSYTVFDLFASYQVTDQLNLRLNVGNVTDEDYYLAAYRSGAFTYVGDARNTRLTLEYEF